MPAHESSQKETYRVVVNDEQQYSIWAYTERCRQGGPTQASQEATTSASLGLRRFGTTCVR
jgi:uncharacterized protein YbdZ (MbtH family)